MEILNEANVISRIAERAIEEGITINQENETKDLFFSLMSEKSNQNKNEQAQISLIDELVREFAYGDTAKKMFKRRCDTRHLSYFDTFLEDGEGDKILNSLKKHNVSTDILKSIKKGVPFDDIIDGVHITQRIERVNDDSPEVVEFSISKDGETLYEWGEDIEPEPYIVEDDIQEDTNNGDIPKEDTNNDNTYDENANYYDAYDEDTKPSNVYTKKGTVRKSIYLLSISTPSGTVTKELMKCGANPNKTVIAYRDKLGRFAEKC